MSLYYLILWNQVEYSSKTLQKGSCPYAPLDEVLRYVISLRLPCPTRGRRPLNYIDCIARDIGREIADMQPLIIIILLMIWQSPGLPGWWKGNFITVTRRPHHPNIAAGLCCLATSPGFLPTLCEKWSGFFYVHRVFLSYTRDRRLKVSDERIGNEDKAPCPRALLPGRGSNRGPPVWKPEALTARLYVRQVV